MLSTTIHKDLTKYRPKVVAGLSTRTLVSIALAVGVTVLSALYFQYVLGISWEDVQIFCMALSLPFWAIGFIQPSGMDIEEWLPLWFRHNFGTQRLVYDNERRVMEFFGDFDPDIEKFDGVSAEYRKLCKNQKGLELYCPGEDADEDR